MSEPSGGPALSERMRRQIDRLLDEADEAARALDWGTVRARARAVLNIDPGNGDALAYVAAAERDEVADGQVKPDAESAASASPEVHPHPTSFVGGRYQVVRFLGEGGKKRVYLARDTRLDRDVAFSLLKVDGLDPEGHSRLRREAQAMAKLGDHPNIVTVFDIGDEAGQPYLVCQYVAGGDLRDALAQAEGHRLPLDDALRVAEQVCQALEHAHARGVIHRDLKPGNVWLSGGSPSPPPSAAVGGRVPPEPPGARGEGASLPLPSAREAGRPPEGPRTGEGDSPIMVKLGDFGLALSLDHTRLTQTGMMVGTVAYMAPEQALGGQVTPRSDLYSLGAMLYELVTGRPPFVSDESVAIITQHLNTPPVAPSWHNPELPTALEGVILRLLEKDPAKRPDSAGEVRQMLANIHPHPLPDAEGTAARAVALSSGARGEASQGAAGRASPSPIYQRTFVGRESELRRLQAAFDGALSGNGSLTMVVGEPGIGKTALCEQISTYVAVRGGKTLVGHCYEEGSLSLPYLPFVEAMRTYVLVREPERLKEELGTGAAEVARIVSEVRDRVQVELRPGGDPEDDRWRLLQAVTGFLRNAGTVQPLLLVLEDLHWADRSTLDLLQHLARNLEGARLLIVGNYRDVEVDRSHPLSGALAELRRAGSFQRIPLRGLTVDEVHRMMANVRGQEVPWSRAEAIHRQTEGNPLFVQEVLRYLVEEGLVTREGGRYAAAEWADPETAIPEGLRDVIGKRLSKLSPECNRLLSTAAVIGREFALATLQRVADQPEEALLSALEEATRVGVLEQQTRVGMMGFRFAHALFRQTLYEEIFAPRRIRIHQAVARALEQQHAVRLEEHAAELAEHFAQSTDAEDLEKAVAYGEIAARRAMSVYAYGEAVHHLEQALQAQDVLHPAPSTASGQAGTKRCDLLLTLAEALMPAGQPLRAADEIAEEAFQLAETAGDAGRAFRASLLAYHAIVRYAGQGHPRLVAERGWGQRADRVAAPGTTERVWADLILGVEAAGRGEHEGQWVLTQRALALARQLHDPEAMVAAATYVLTPSTPAAHHRDWLPMAEEAARWPRRWGGDRRSLALFLSRCAGALLDSSREQADALWQELHDLAAQTRDPGVALISLLAEATVAYLDGDLEGAVSVAGRMATLGEGQGVAGYQMSRNASWRSLILLGRAEEAIANVVVNDVPSQRAVLLGHLGRADQAHTFMLEELQREDTPTSVTSSLIEAATLIGDRDAAKALLPRLVPLAAYGPGTTSGHPFCVARQLGAAAALLGRPEEARAYFQQAIEVCTRARFRPELALSRFGLAELLLKSALTPQPLGAEREEARQHLNFAIKEFEAMKMAPSLERALHLRAQLEEIGA